MVQPKNNAVVSSFLKWAANAAVSIGVTQYKVVYGGGYCDFNLVNNADVGHRCTMYKVRVRQNIPEYTPTGSYPSTEGQDPQIISKCFTQDVGETKMNQALATVAYTDPVATLGMSNLFTTMFEVVKSKHYDMPPGGRMKFKHVMKGSKRPMNFKDLIEPVAASSSTLYRANKKWNPYFYIFHCVGLLGTGATSGNGTTASQMLVECCEHHYVGLVNDNSLATGVFVNTVASTYNAVGAVSVYNQPAATAQS